MIAPFLLAKKDGLNKSAWADISERCADYKALWSQWDRLEVKGSLLFRKCEGGKTNPPCWQLLVPKERWKEVFRHLHEHGARFLSPILSQISWQVTWLRLQSQVTCGVFCFLKWLHKSLGPKSLGLLWNAPDCFPSNVLLTSPCISVNIITMSHINTILMSLNAAP